MATLAPTERVGIADSEIADAVPFDAPASALGTLFPDPGQCQLFLETVRTAAEDNQRIVRRLQGTGRWRSPCFEFARRLRWEPKLRDLRAEDAEQIVEDALGVIFPQDKEEFLWEHVIGHSDTDGQQVDPFLDFLDCWEKLRQTPSALAEAVAEARANPRPGTFYGEKLAGLKWERFREFLAIADVLQNRAGEGSIFLAVQPLGALLGVSAEQVSTYRRRAERYGFLVKLAEARPGRAAEFRFDFNPQSG